VVAGSVALPKRFVCLPKKIRSTTETQPCVRVHVCVCVCVCVRERERERQAEKGTSHGGA